jgi:hypothetical protein
MTISLVSKEVVETSDKFQDEKTLL